MAAALLSLGGLLPCLALLIIGRAVNVTYRHHSAAAQSCVHTIIVMYLCNNNGIGCSAAGGLAGSSSKGIDRPTYFLRND